MSPPPGLAGSPAKKGVGVTEAEVPLFPRTSEKVVPPAASGAGSEMQAMMQAMMAQSAALAELMSKSGKAEPRVHADLRSTIQVKPTIRWPTLDDGDYKIDDFLKEFEATVGMANDAKGMLPSERLVCLGSCLRQSRHLVYKGVMKTARRNGKLVSDPAAVFDEVVARLLEFKEGIIERQTRVQTQWDGLVKGKFTAVQFLPRFEEVVDELELHGLAKSERELLLGYLKRVGGSLHQEILKDRRSYSIPIGGEEMRQVKTWREAHRILVELEQVSDDNKALIAAIDGEGGSGGGKGHKNKKKDDTDTDQDVIGGVNEKGLCFQMRDKGKCEREGCTFDHDPKKIKAAQAALAAKGKGKGDVNAVQLNNGGDKQKGNGKGERDSSNDTPREWKKDSWKKDSWNKDS